MADFVFNVAKGRVAEFHERVNNNDPTNSALILVVINANGATDATMKDYATLSALLGDASVAEVTNTNYARKTITDADLAAITIDNTNDRVDADITADATWNPGPSAGDAWTDLIVCYDSDTTAGTDANIIPLVCLDFAVTPDGSIVTAQWNASGYYRAS